MEKRSTFGESDLIAARKRGNAERRGDLMCFFDAHGFRYTPSVANHLMVDARRPTLVLTVSPEYRCYTPPPP